MKKKSIGHLSHGKTLTGGFRLEQNLLDSLSKHFEENNTQVDKQTSRIDQYFKGFGHFKLLWWGFKQAKADVNIVVARCALSAIVRNWFTKRKIIIVFHNYDETDGKGALLEWYFKLLFTYLSYTQSSRIAIVAVAPFWVDYFNNKINSNIPVLLFPNLFDTQAYVAYQTSDKRKQIHLGQYSSKNSKNLFVLANLLTQQGYQCFFTTLHSGEQGLYPDYEVRYVSDETYLTEMAQSEYTLAYIGINEGWNRIAHESILVGTQVIGVNKAGLGNLLTESGSLMADSLESFYKLVVTKTESKVNPEFVNRYDVNNAHEWIKPIALFCDAE